MPAWRWLDTAVVVCYRLLRDGTGSAGVWVRCGWAGLSPLTSSTALALHLP